VQQINGVYTVFVTWAEVTTRS